MRRREFVVFVGGALGLPLVGLAQPAAKVHRIGFLGTAFASGYVREVEWVRGGLSGKSPRNSSH
jgi:hypothetical protein